MKIKGLLAIGVLIAGIIFGSYYFFAPRFFAPMIPPSSHNVLDTEQNDTILVKNWKEATGGKMRNFRSPQSIKNKKLKKPLYKGLCDVNASGSAQVFYDHIKELKKFFPNKKIILVDLRQESHGFINGLPISWYNKFNDANKGKTLAEIEQDEKDKLNDILKNKNIAVYTLVRTAKHQPKIGTNPITIAIKNVLTERELAHMAGIGYVRFPIQDWNAPTDDQVDRFVAFVKNLPKNAWLHFHCKAGRGRTTVFMTMYDMMLNAHKVGFETILKRQNKLGGINFFDDGFTHSIKYRGALARMNFIRLFYTYAKDAYQNNFQQTWTEWLKEHLN